MFYSYKQYEALLPCFTMSIYSGDVVSKDVLKSFRNLLQDEDGTSVKKVDEDLPYLPVYNAHPCIIRTLIFDQ